METRQLGSLWPVSRLVIGGGGLGQIWGETDRDEAVATLKSAIDQGINLIDMAPMYGRGEAERVVGATFGGKLPEGVRITTKCQLGSPAKDVVMDGLELALKRSSDATKLDYVDIFFLHSNICPDGYVYEHNADVQDRFATTWSIYVDHFIPAMEALKQKGRIGAWGITGTGIPDTIIDALSHEVKPAVVQAVANLMDSAGGMRRYGEPAQPREIIAAARKNEVGVLGIRAVQAGALCAELDRDLPDDNEEVLDYKKAAPYRELCAKLGQDPAALAHQYALSMEGVDAVILGVKNRQELDQLIKAEAEGTLNSAVTQQIDTLNLRS